MLKPTFDMASAQLVHLQGKIGDLLKKEQKIYEALVVLVNFLSGGKKLGVRPASGFPKLKKEIVAAVAELEVKCKNKGSTPGPKFNVKHYERAIIYASDPSYRDMAIQAASKDLNREAMTELVLSLRRHCQDVNRDIRHLSTELRHKQQVKGGAHGLLQNVVEPILDGDGSAAPVSA